MAFRAPYLRVTVLPVLTLIVLVNAVVCGFDEPV